MEKRMMIIIVIDWVIVGAIILLNFLLFKDVSNLFISINIIAAIMFITPIALIKYYEIWKIRALEDYFPQFMRDLVESVRAGMTLPKAIDSISGNDYGRLSPYIRRLNAQLNWGIPFNKALMKFSESTKSKLIGRIASTIIESHRFGGNLTDIFEAISTTSVEIERLREERKLYMNSQLITGYIIYFVFLIVLIGLQRYLIPTLTGVTIGEITTASSTDITGEYTAIFRNLVIMQGLFAGLVIGKMSEGAVAGGIKHSLFLVISGIVIYTIATF